MAKLAVGRRRIDDETGNEMGEGEGHGVVVRRASDTNIRQSFAAIVLATSPVKIDSPKWP